MKSIIARAVLSGDLRLFVQPIVGAYNDHVGWQKSEVLVRLHHEGQIIEAGKFIPIVQADPKLAMTLDKWVISQCLSTLDLRSKRRIFINLNPSSISEEMIEFIEATCSYNQVDPQHLCFEISEKIQSRSDAHAFGERLSDLGCAFAIDDFCSGQTNITDVLHAEADYIKLDATVARGVNVARQRAFYSYLIPGLVSTGAVVIAEGVESLRETEILTSCGVRWLQGYLYGKPEPVKPASNDN
ncbi:MAG: EAL domain-containing protein [Cyanobacteria bacterium P01_F01_bin.4]